VKERVELLPAGQQRRDGRGRRDEGKGGGGRRSVHAMRAGGKHTAVMRPAPDMCSSLALLADLLVADAADRHAAAGWKGTSCIELQIAAHIVRQLRIEVLSCEVHGHERT